MRQVSVLACPVVQEILSVRVSDCRLMDRRLSGMGTCRIPPPAIARREAFQSAAF